MADMSLTLLATVDELSSVDALCSNEELCPLLETVGVTEGYFGQGSTTAGVMDDILIVEERKYVKTSNRASSMWPWCPVQKSSYLHNPLDVTMAFSEVNMTEFSGTFPVLDVGFEHGARTFSLSPDHTSHRVLGQDDRWRYLQFDT